jgi:putative ABC transport system permease protein
MLSNYIKIAFRNLFRHKIYSIINIMGLAIGMACAILLLLFVRDELSYDRHNSKYKRIYMVQSHFTFEGREPYYYGSSFAIGPTLKDEYPAVEESVRTYQSDRIYFFDQKREPIGEDSVCYADPAIFKAFDHKFIYGSPEGAMDTPKSIVLSETLAKKYFGEQNPVGKTLSRNNGVDYIVKGVFKDLFHNSIRRYTALIPMMDLTEIFGVETLNSRGSCDFYFCSSNIFTYVLINENADIKSITGDLERFRKKYITECGKKQNGDFEPIFQPLTDVYLHYRSSLDSTPLILLRIYLLTFLALSILIIACINYMNLATARSAGRAREVGVRKVLGADKSSLIRQFLCESMIISVVALLIALTLIELFLPSFNNLAAKEIAFSVISEPTVFTGLLVVTLIVGLISGSYPAFSMSSLIPANVIRGDTQLRKGRGRLRKLLVIVQFTISIIVIITAMLSQRQMNYLHHMDLGFNKNNVLVITAMDTKVIGSISTFKNEILKNNGVLAVSRSNNTAGTGDSHGTYSIEDSRGKMVNKWVSQVTVDFDFIDLMGMKVLEGRSFRREIGTDQTEAVLVNETLVKEMGWSGSPIGKRIQLGDGNNKRNGKVIGVLKDFYFQSLATRLMPMIVLLKENTDNVKWPLVVSIKTHPENSEKTIEFIKKKWLELNPRQPFEYKFLDDIIRKQYQDNDKFASIFNYSAFLSIFISCLGLFSLTSFLAEKRTKEIGIRKVHGASVWNILFLLSYDFIKLVLISIIIAWPTAYYANARLLEIYAYRVEMSWLLFVLGACIALLIALITVSYHAIKAALTDPVKALRYE